MSDDGTEFALNVFLVSWPNWWRYDDGSPPHGSIEADLLWDAWGSVDHDRFGRVCDLVLLPR